MKCKIHLTWNYDVSDIDIVLSKSQSINFYSVNKMRLSPSSELYKFHIHHTKYVYMSYIRSLAKILFAFLLFEFALLVSS